MDSDNRKCVQTLPLQSSTQNTLVTKQEVRPQVHYEVVGDRNRKYRVAKIWQEFRRNVPRGNLRFSFCDWCTGDCF